MRRLSLFVAVVLCLPKVTMAQTNESVVPAGTLLECTLDEPRFSSETAQVGEPVVCHVGALGMFGSPVFPRGAYLSGRLVDFRDPGHFYGKGWLKLEFESLTLPGGTFSVAAKVVSVPHYRVDAEGRIRGRGHSRRDSIEWAIPILWPEKILTLPMRGPRPALKGETRILLRLLEDVAIPSAAAVTSNAALSTPQRSALRSRVNPGANPSANTGMSPSAGPGLTSSVSSSTPNAFFPPRLRYGGASIPAAKVERPLMTPPVEGERTILSKANQLLERPWRAPRPTFLICKDGRGYVVTNYWFDGAGQLVYVASDGTRQTLPPEQLDLDMTANLNRERGVPFVIRSKPSEP